MQCPMGTVPILDVGCACIPQSKAIERYVAKRLGLLGIDSFEEALVDSVCELIRDLEQSLNADGNKYGAAQHRRSC
jgi:glutathione S-transferase